MACSDSDFDYLRRVVHERSANLIDPACNALFDSRLKPVACSAGAASLEEFVGILKSDRTQRLHSTVAEAMTINETSFFRDVRTFDTLAESILPRLIEVRSPEKRLRIWSAAGSTGQEAYSVAMTICERFPALAAWDVKITATDISRPVVEYARRGRFRRLEVNRGLPARQLVKYFERDGEEWQIVPQVKAMCEFQHANLCGPLPLLPAFDLVLLRNVLLYFSQADRHMVLGRVHRHMASDGFLVLGASEQAEDSTTLFQTEFAGKCYFYRPRKPAVELHL